MQPAARIQISILFLLQFFIWGTWGASMGIWMEKTMHFTPAQMATAWGAGSLAAMISPLIVGMVADRFFPAQKVLGFLHLLGGGLLFVASLTTQFSIFYPIILAHTLCYMPTLALINTVAFSQMQDPAKSFGSIRVLGTFGWIAAGFVIGKLGYEPSANQFVAGAIASVVLGLFCYFVLPNVPPKAKGQPMNVRAALGLDALQLFKERSFAIFAIGFFLFYIPAAFYFFGAGQFLNSTGLKEVATKMTYGQMSEVIFMLLFPFIFAKLGVKKMLLLGVACWIARFLCFANGDANSGYWLLILGIVLHGPAFDFFSITGYVYVDQRAPRELRAAAQSLVAFLSYGAGLFSGSLTQGYVVGLHTKDGVTNWSATWNIAAIGAAALFVLYLLFFKDEKAAPAQIEEQEPVKA